MTTFPHSQLVAAFAASAIAAAHPALAQTCAAPGVLTANTVHLFDTCQGETSLVVACGIVDLAGPATVVRLDLPYPVGEISIQTGNADYQPFAFLLRADCDGHAPCQAAAWINPVGSIDLSAIESGRYFLVVAADRASPATCGPVSVVAHLTPEQAALGFDGVFRSGNAPIWEP